MPLTGCGNPDDSRSANKPVKTLFRRSHYLEKRCAARTPSSRVCSPCVSWETLFQRITRCAIRKMANAALAKMNGLFAGMYEAEVKGGRPSVAPEKLLRAMLLQVLYSLRSERQLMEQVKYNLLFRWFIGLLVDDSVWVPTVFTKNREHG